MSNATQMTLEPQELRRLAPAHGSASGGDELGLSPCKGQTFGSHPNQVRTRSHRSLKSARLECAPLRASAVSEASAKPPRPAPQANCCECCNARRRLAINRYLRNHGVKIHDEARGNIGALRELRRKMQNEKAHAPANQKYEQPES